MSDIPMDVRQAAYIRLRAILDRAAEIKKDLDEVLGEAYTLADENDLVLEVRFSDALPDTLDPTLYGAIADKYGKEFRFYEHIESNSDEGIYPGESLDSSWIPSSLC